jgi:ATP-dependent Clp protease ATP-binding subunit ClpC
VVGRQREVARLAQVLARESKSNPVLLGEAGVGKTAVVEGLAQLIAAGQAPAHLRDVRIVELPVASLVAGTRYRGDLEERLTAVIREATQPGVILFLDELHTLVGAGRADGAALDAGNVLKPALARGDLRCIGATTLAEYQRSIERDAALARRFQPVLIEEPSPEDTLRILRETRGRYEAHHGVQLTDEALEAAVRLSVAHLPDRRLPDKAADLVDEACARARVGTGSRWGQTVTGDAQTIVVTADQVAQVVADLTGIPVGRLTAAEQAHLLELESSLRRRVVGQDEALTAVARAVRLGRSGLRPPGRPVGVFLFLGPTGTGKTHVARALAEAVYGSERELIRLDMSEFSEPHTVARLIGAPPGYLGYQDEGQLTGALRRRPAAVVLLDEMDKAHPQVYDLFLQLFDDGRLTDGQGRTVDGSNAIFIMTANVASEVFERRRTVGFATRTAPSPAREPETFRGELMAELRRTFRAEFLNRIDDIVGFHRLTPEHCRRIARMQLDELGQRLLRQHGIALVVDESVLEVVVREGYSAELGARPLERTIQRLVAQPLSEAILGGARGPLTATTRGGSVIIEASTIRGGDLT